MKKAAASLVLIFATIAACGGGTPESTTPPPASSQASPSSSAASTAAPSATASAAPVDLQAKLEAQHDPFMNRCMGPTTTKEYCECGFEQFKQVFKGMDPDKNEPTKEQIEELKTKTIGACASKLSEPTIKASFVASCSSSDARMTPYCDCAWGSLRKTLSLADFAGEGGARFEEAKKRMTEECKTKMPEAAVKDIFVGACTKESGDAKACECMWKKVRAKFSAAQIASGTADVKSVPVADCKKK